MKTNITSPLDGAHLAVVICREDDPTEVDAAYGPGTYARHFPACIDCCAPATHTRHYRDSCPTDRGEQVIEGDEPVCNECDPPK